MFKKTTLFYIFYPLLIANVSFGSNVCADGIYEKVDYDKNIERLYYSLNKKNFAPPQLKVYEKAVKGYFKYKSNRRISGDIITMIDYSLPSTQKRLWIIDFNTNTIILNCLVAHGINSGGLVPNDFSNDIESHKSSLGYFSTAEVYEGVNGTSLRLDGLEENINDNARDRDIVMHGADYVSESFIFEKGFLGRSYGCPAIPVELSLKIINMIKNQNLLFIYHNSISQ